MKQGGGMKKFVVGTAVAAGAMVALAAPAHADITSGSCDATINGVPIRGRSASDPSAAIDVDAHSKVVVTATSGAPIDGFTIEMTYVGYTWEVAKGTSDGSSWTREVDVDKYAKFGGGLYRVTGTSTGAGACTGSALIKITGRYPLTTVAGAVSAIVAALGIGGLGMGLRSASRKVMSPGMDHSSQYRIFEEGAQPTDRTTAIVDTFQSASTPADYTDALIHYANAGAGPSEMSVITQPGSAVQQHIQSLVTGGGTR